MMLMMEMQLRRTLATLHDLRDVQANLLSTQFTVLSLCVVVVCVAVVVTESLFLALLTRVACSHGEERLQSERAKIDKEREGEESEKYIRMAAILLPASLGSLEE